MNYYEKRVCYGILSIENGELLVSVTPINENYTLLGLDKIIKLESGNLLITMKSKNALNPGLFGKVIDLSGNIVQPIFQMIDLPTTSLDYSPEVTSLGEGRVLITYTNITESDSFELFGMVYKVEPNNAQCKDIGG